MLKISWPLGWRCRRGSSWKKLLIFCWIFPSVPFLRSSPLRFQTRFIFHSNDITSCVDSCKTTVEPVWKEIDSKRIKTDIEIATGVVSFFLFLFFFFFAFFFLHQWMIVRLVPVYSKCQILWYIYGSFWKYAQETFIFKCSATLLK